MTARRSQIQIDVPTPIRNRAKAVAYDNGQTLTELVLLALQKIGDEELTALIKKDLKERAQRGRPSISD